MIQYRLCAAFVLFLALVPADRLVNADTSRPVGPTADTQFGDGPCSFSNGGLNPQPFTQSGVPAPDGYMWSELQHNVGNTTQANSLNGVWADQAADDFTLTAACTIETLSFYTAISTEAEPGARVTELRLKIWQGVPEAASSSVVFGDSANRLVSSVDTGYLRTENTAVPTPGATPRTTLKIWRNTANVRATLSPGTYWAHWTTIAAKPNGQRANTFQPPRVISGSRGAAGDNARAFLLTFSPGWAPVIDLGSPIGEPYIAQDFPFDVVGSPAAAVGISGRVVGPNGLAIRNATVILTDSTGTRFTATTGSFGSYSFKGVYPGAGYTISVMSKRYRFAPRVLDITESLANVDLAGLE